MRSPPAAGSSCPTAGGTLKPVKVGYRGVIFHVERSEFFRGFLFFFGTTANLPLSELPVLRHGTEAYHGLDAILAYLRTTFDGVWNLDLPLEPVQRADCLA